MIIWMRAIKLSSRTPRPGHGAITAAPGPFGARFRAALAVFLLLPTLFAGCAPLSGKDRPPADLIDPDRIELSRGLKLASGDWPEARWWERYGDEQLNRLVTQALKDSPDLAVARARLEMAKSRAEMVRASHGPLVGGFAAITRQHVSDAGFLGPYAADAPLLGLTGPWYTSGLMGLFGTYTFDIWGRNRAQTEAALGRQNAALAETAQAELLLAAGLTQTYYGLQTLRETVRLLREARAVESEMLAAHEARRSRGLESRTPADLARAGQLEMDQQISAAETEIGLMEEALQALLGLSGPRPEILPAPLPAVAGTLPPTLGYDLLARRADLQVARWTIQAGLGEVQAARAAFYPSFDLRLFYGLDAIHLEDLFKKGSQQFNLIGGLSLPIFDSGRLNAGLQAAQAARDLTIAEYNQAVVRAVREVAQAGLRLEGLDREVALQRRRLDSVTQAEKSARAHYRTGLVDQVTAREARLPVLVEQGRLLELRGRQVGADIDLILALGGGFHSYHDPLGQR